MCTTGSSEHAASTRRGMQNAAMQRVFLLITGIVLGIIVTSVCVAFRSNNPRAPVHFLVVPTESIPALEFTDDDDAELLGHMMNVARKTAVKEGLDNGYRVVINDGPDGAQSIYHLHIHVMGGRQMGWPPG